MLSLLYGNNRCVPWQKHPPFRSVSFPLDPRTPSASACNLRTSLLFGGSLALPLLLLLVLLLDGELGLIRSEGKEDVFFVHGV
jgi:hypothetical protein